jgi:hypothetical protein
MQPENNQNDATATKEELASSQYKKNAADSIYWNIHAAENSNVFSELNREARQSLRDTLTPYDSNSLNHLLKRDPETLLKVAEMYLRGRHGFEKDALIACALAEGAGKLHFPKAWKMLAEWHKFGAPGIPPDREKANIYYAKMRNCGLYVEEFSIAHPRHKVIL